jgi:hypothetical protein
MRRIGRGGADRCAAASSSEWATTHAGRLVGDAAKLEKGGSST